MKRRAAKRVPWRRVLKTLTDVFGVTTFRPGQDTVVRNVLERRNTLAIMPTGAGKSLCYQLPALLMPGTTIVVSPLISLMKDQAEKLGDLGLDAHQLNSAIPTRDQRDSEWHIRRGGTEFVFTTPERLASVEFLRTLKRSAIDLVVIDEAHCISQWGHDFRPAYLELRGAIASLGQPPILALTATATDQVVRDIGDQLGVGDFRVVNTGVYRPNLHYAVHLCEGDDLRARLLDRILENAGGTGIIYTATVKGADALYAELSARFGDAVARYHGRLSAAARHDAQDRFMRGDLRVMVATNAFGMGIDKPDIRFVVHHGMPGSLEAYMQESGRAGRDGQPAECALLYQRGDRQVQLFFLGGKYPDEAAVTRVVESLRASERGRTLVDLQHDTDVARPKLRVVLSVLKGAGLVCETRGARFHLVSREGEQADARAVAMAYKLRAEADRARLDRMIAYAQTRLCRWKALLDYFEVPEEIDRCGHCDNCMREAADAARGAEDEPRPPAILTIGDLVRVEELGEGEIIAMHGDMADVKFPKGETRTFRAGYLQGRPRSPLAADR